MERTVKHLMSPSQKQGFLGKGHIARDLFGGLGYEETNPFIIFMDDTIKTPGGYPVEGAHPHAGFETATLTLYNHQRRIEQNRYV